MLVGENIKIDRLHIEDAYQMVNWGKMNGIMGLEYEFLNTESRTIEEWYRNRIGIPNMESYSVKLLNDEVIGSISIRNIDKKHREAVLGIVFSENYVGKGFGTKSLKLFLDYYFNKLDMKLIQLEVATHNERAIRCYQKLGFRTHNMVYSGIEMQYHGVIVKEILKQDNSQYSEHFLVKDGDIFMKYQRMYCKKNSFNRRYKIRENGKETLLDKILKAPKSFIDSFKE